MRRGCPPKMESRLAEVARMFHEGASSEREGGSGAGARGRGRSSRDRARSGGGVRDRRKVQPVWKSTGVSGAPTILHEVISRRQRSRAAESIGERPHRHAVVLTSRRWRGGRRMTPRRRPGPAAAADDEARNHQRGVPRHTNDVGATPGAPRPRPTIKQHRSQTFTSTLGTRPRLARKQLRIEKKTTPGHDSRKRVASTS